jgi:hypothetical protein
MGNKKEKKRWIAAGLAACMVAVLLAACHTDSGASSGNTVTNSKAEETTGAETIEVETAEDRENRENRETTGEADRESQSEVLPSSEADTAAFFETGEQETVAEEKDLTLSYTFADETTGIWFLYPEADLVEDEESTVFQMEDYNIFYLRDTRAGQSVSDVPVEEWKRVLSPYLSSDENISLEITDSSRERINGISMEKFQGSIQKSKEEENDGEDALLFTGYLFWEGDIAHELIGILNQEASQDKYEELQTLVEEMIWSIREGE